MIKRFSQLKMLSNVDTQDKLKVFSLFESIDEYENNRGNMFFAWKKRTLYII